MSTKPSWLDDEDNQAAATSAAVSVASNPVAQKVAKDVAKDPKVQSAVKEAAWASVSGSTPKATPVEEPVNAPSWASESYTPPAATGKDIESGAGSAAGAPSEEFTMDPEELKNMQKWHLALRLSYMTAAIIMCAAAVVALMNTAVVTNNIGLAFFAIYIIFFCLIIFCFEVAFSVSIEYWSLIFYFGI